MLSRHKRRVNRRIALLERLATEVLEHLILGLLPLTVGRVNCRLPKGQTLSYGHASPRGKSLQGGRNA